MTEKFPSINYERRNIYIGINKKLNKIFTCVLTRVLQRNENTRINHSLLTRNGCYTNHVHCYLNLVQE